MTLTDEEKSSLLYNPGLIQKLILSEIENNSGNTISSATNPFVMLVESTASLSSALAIESRNIIRKKFPSLAQTVDDIFQHLTDEELDYIFATPAEATIRFSLEVTKLKSSGYKPTGANYFETEIPTGSVVNVHDYSFTIINPILIRIYDKIETPYVEVLTSSDKMAYPDPSIINAKRAAQIVHGNTPIPFIEFDVPLKQVTIKTVTSTINKSTGCTITVPLSDQYCASTVTVKGDSTGNKEIELQQTFSEDYLDPSTPKVYTSLGDGKVTFKIPDIYVRSGLISGSVTVKVYQTKGVINLPLKSFTADEFSIVYGKRKSPSETTITSQSIVMRAVSNLVGGKNAMSLDELKKSLIQGTTGPLDIPITDYQIVKSGENLNYSISKVEDSLTKRKYIASKSLPKPDRTTQIKAMPDVFMNKVGVMYEEIEAFFPECVKTNMFLIKARTVFKENNGKLLITPQSELNEINGMEILNKIQHYKDNKYFYNPFTYIVDMSEETTKTRVYYLDNPIMESLRVINKNLNLTDVNATIEKYGVYRTDNGYEILIKLLGDNGYNKINKKYVKLQLGLPIDGNGYVYFYGEYNEQDDCFHFKLETSDFITQDDKIQILNGESDIPTRFTTLYSKMEVICYVVDPNVKDIKGYLRENIMDTNPDKASLFLDTINIRFGRKIDYMWSETYSSYTDRQYKRYKSDVFKTYEENVYATDVNGNMMFEKQSDTQIRSIILHRKGDQVLDAGGAPIKLHSAGDIVLDEYGDPIIDTIPGVIKYVDILMLEYEFMLVSSVEGINLREMIMSFFEEMLFNELPSLNGKLLEQTDIYYKSNRSVNPVSVTVNGSKYSIPYTVRPTITLYLDSGVTLSTNERDVYKVTIGNIINKHLDKEKIYINDIKTDIKNSINVGLSGVKIENLGPVDTEVITVNDDNRLTLAKELFFTDYNETIVKYDITLKTVNL